MLLNSTIQFLTKIYFILGDLLLQFSLGTAIAISIFVSCFYYRFVPTIKKSLLSFLLRTTVSTISNTNKTAKVTSTWGVVNNRSKKFAKSASKSIVDGGTKRPLDANVPKKVLLNFTKFPSALLSCKTKKFG